jgi:hypothetical protein
MGNDLHAASSQWATRPADERFWNLGELHSACIASRDGSRTARVAFNQLHASADVNAEVLISGDEGTHARLTHYAFGQLATAVGAPAGYLRELPADTAAQCLNIGFEKHTDSLDRDLLFHANGALTLRACLSERYERVWDADVCQYLRTLTDDGWRPPAGRVAPDAESDPRNRSATADDILPGQINIDVGTLIGPAGLYASDHDMFAFLVAPDRVISDGAGGGLMRGVFVRNSEVGDAALSFTFFLMQAVCGNHIVWSAQGVHEVRVRHVGQAPLRRALNSFSAELRRYRDGAAEEEAGIVAARKMTLGNTKEEILEALVKYAKTHSIPLSKRQFSDGYDVAEKHQDWYGAPNTVWAQVAGLTQASQASGFAHDRATIDRAAGKIMQMAF